VWKRNRKKEKNLSSIGQCFNDLGSLRIKSRQFVQQIILGTELVLFEIHKDFFTSKNLCLCCELKSWIEKDSVYGGEQAEKACN